jgi:hypothetical protein
MRLKRVFHAALLAAAITTGAAAVADPGRRGHHRLDLACPDNP